MLISVSSNILKLMMTFFLVQKVIEFIFSLNCGNKRLALIFCRNEEFYVKIKFQGIVEAKEYRPYYGINTNSKNEGVEGNYTNNSIFVLITTNLGH